MGFKFEYGINGSTDIIKILKDIDSEDNKEKYNDCKYDPHNHGTKRMMLEVFHMFVCFDNIIHRRSV